MKIDKNLLFIFVGRIIQAVIAILSFRIMTTLLSKNEIGNQYVISALILGFNLVLINPFGMYVNRHVHEWFAKGQFLSALKKINLYFLATSVLSIPILILIKEAGWAAEKQDTALVVTLIVGYTYLSTWFLTLASFFNLFNRQKQFVILNIVSQILGLILAYALVSIYSLQTFYWLLGLLLGQVGSLLLGLYFIKKSHFFGLSLQPDYSPKPVRLFTLGTLQFCYPVAFATVFMWFQNQGYRLVVDKYLGSEALAGLGVGLGIAASLAGVIESLTTQYLHPKYYSVISNASIEARKAAWEKMWRLAIAIYIPCAFVVAAVSSVLIRLLTTSMFHMYENLICVGAVLELFRQLANIVYLISHSEKNTKLNMIPYFCGSMSLAVGLFISYKYFSLNMLNIIGILLFASFITLSLNFFVAFQNSYTRFYFKDILRSILLSVPVLLFIRILDHLSFMTIALSMVLGLYTLGIIYYQLRKQEVTT